MSRKIRKLKRYLEYFDKNHDRWVRIENYNEEAMKVYDFIMAEIEISCLIEDMKMKYKFDTEDKN